MKEIQFTPPFKRRLKKLQKRYRQIKQDIQPLLTELQQGNLIGNQITGVSQIVYKARAKNSDIPTGKSGGYRLIYQVVSNQVILLLIIYAKSGGSRDTREIGHQYQETMTFIIETLIPVRFPKIYFNNN